MKKNKNKSKKQKKSTSQLIRLCSYLKDFLSTDSKIENFNLMWNISWKNSAILTEIDSNDKITAANIHNNKILALQQNHSENIIIYSDGSKLSESQADAGSYISFAINEQQSYS